MIDELSMQLQHTRRSMPVLGRMQRAGRLGDIVAPTSPPSWYSWRSMVFVIERALMAAIAKVGVVARDANRYAVNFLYNQ
jgi:hypothetical protein